jgi:CheY-like chemotaxis protein
MSDVYLWVGDGRRLLPVAAAGGDRRGIDLRVGCGQDHRARASGRGSIMNGALTKTSAVSRFLPDGVPVAGQEVRTHPHRGAATVARQTATILVVDDEPRMRRVARRMLSELGYQVLEAENAAVAVRLLDTDASIDLLFTDVVMPGEIDGRALGRWARQAHPGLGVLLTSGFTQQTAGVDSPCAAPLPLLSKPYSKEQLQQAVQTLLRGQTS